MSETNIILAESVYKNEFILVNILYFGRAENCMAQNDVLLFELGLVRSELKQSIRFIALLLFCFHPAVCKKSERNTAARC
jgi:hypothetical protein